MALFSTSPRIPPPKIDSDCGSLSVFSTFAPPPGFRKREPHLEVLVSPRSRKQLRSSGSARGSSFPHLVAPSESNSPSRVSSARSVASTAIGSSSARSVVGAASIASTCKLGRDSIGGTATTYALPCQTVSEGLMAGIAQRRKFTRMKAQLAAFDRSYFPPANSSSTGCSVVSDFRPPPAAAATGKVEIGDPTHSSTHGTMARAARPRTLAKNSADDEGPAAFNPREQLDSMREKERGSGTAAFKKDQPPSSPRSLAQLLSGSDDDHNNHVSPRKTCSSGRGRSAFLNTGAACNAHAYQPLADWTASTHHREVNKYVPPSAATPRPPPRRLSSKAKLEDDEPTAALSPKKAVSFKKKDVFVY